MSFVDHLSDTRLGRQQIVRAAFQITFPFGMKANDVPMARRTQLYKPAKRIFIKRAFPGIAALAEERRIHRKPAHHEIYEPADRIVVKEPAADGEEKIYRSEEHTSELQSRP